MDRKCVTHAIMSNIDQWEQHELNNKVKEAEEGKQIREDK